MHETKTSRMTVSSRIVFSAFKSLILLAISILSLIKLSSSSRLRYIDSIGFSFGIDRTLNPSLADSRNALPRSMLVGFLESSARSRENLADLIEECDYRIWSIPRLSLRTELAFSNANQLSCWLSMSISASWMRSASFCGSVTARDDDLRCEESLCWLVSS